MKLLQISKNFWDKQILKEKSANVFHSSWWIELTADIFNKNPLILYIVKYNNNSYLISLFFEQALALQYSIGFIGHGGPILAGNNSDALCQEMLQCLILELENIFGTSPQKIICNPLSDPEEYQLQNYDCNINKTQILDITKNSDFIFEQQISGNVRTAIRKAKKDNVYVVEKYTNNELSQAYNLLKNTQISVQSSYITPYKFFQSLTNSSFSSLFIAKQDNKIIAISVCLFFESKAFFFLNGWDRLYSSSCPNYLLIWEMIKNAKNRGCHTFNFGSSHSDTLRKSKSQWGTSDSFIINLEKVKNT